MRATIWFAVGVAALTAWAVGGDGWSGTNGKAAAPKSDDRAALIRLGQRLFFDPAASRTGRTSCVSCHDPEHGFTDVAHPSADETGPSRRRSMTVTDLPPLRLHSDGEFADLRALIRARLRPFEDLNVDRDPTLRSFGFGTYADQVSPVPAMARVVDRVAEGGFYDDAFAAAFGDRTATLEHVMDALEAYVYSIRTDENALDRYLSGDAEALLPAQRRGFELFEGKAGCATCHVTTPVGGRAPLHDSEFHDVGVSWRSARLAGVNDPADGDAGLGAHGRMSADRRRDHMRFRTPSLRDVARRGPYMHDGSMRTLIDVIEFFDRGGERHFGLDKAVRPLGLSDAEKDDLVAFLLALSGTDRAGLASPPANLGRATTVRLVSPDGAPIRGANVALEAAGDRFRGVPIATSTRIVPTDETGRVTFAFPPSTHVRLRIDGFVVDGGRLLPDVAGDRELIAVPLDTVALRVLCGDDEPAAWIRAQPLAVADLLGRPTTPFHGESIVFKLARRTRNREALYVARTPESPGSALRLLAPRGGGAEVVVAQAHIDLTPGGITFVDLHPQFGVPRPDVPDAHAAR